MPSSASQRRTEMDRLSLDAVQHGPAPTAPFVPSWRRGAIRTCAIVLLVLIYSGALLTWGYLWALASLGLL